MKRERKKGDITVAKRFLDSYQEDRQIRKKAVKSLWFWYMPMLAVFIIVANVIVTEYLGDGAFGYTEQAYDDVWDAMEKNVHSEYTEEGELVAGIDEVKLLQQIDILTRTFNRDRGVSTLDCTKKDGYFEATITVDLDESYNIMHTNRNFDSRAEYAQYYRNTVLFWTIILGVGVWFIIAGIGVLLLKIIVLICKKIEEKHTTASETQKVTVETKLEVVDSGEKTA